MRDVLVVLYQSRDDALALATSISETLSTEGINVRITLADVGADLETPSKDTLVVSLGGDGTFLRAARLAHGAGAEVLGVNLGRVGFLLSVPPGTLLQEIRRALRRELPIETRMGLIVTSDDGALREFCLNEVVVERSHAGRMVRLTCSIEGDEFLTYSADGVLVSTATGSTGYNFSAGGPVISPDLNVMVVTPIAPHFTIDRSIVVGAHQTIRLETVDRDGAVVCDGTVVGTLGTGEGVTVSAAPEGVLVAVSEQLGLGARLRHSLREGHAEG